MAAHSSNVTTGHSEYLLRVEVADLGAFKHWHTDILVGQAAAAAMPVLAFYNSGYLSHPGR